MGIADGTEGNKRKQTRDVAGEIQHFGITGGRNKFEAHHQESEDQKRSGSRSEEAIVEAYDQCRNNPDQPCSAIA